MENNLPKEGHSTKKISENLILEIKSALKAVQPYGSVEIFVQNGNVTQITIRNIKKTSNLQIQDK